MSGGGAALLVSLVCSALSLVSTKDISGCCTKIRIASDGGESLDHQSNRLGDYSLIGSLADRPIYKNLDRDEFLFYLQRRNKGLWMVGPEAEKFNGGLAHRGDKMCVEDVVKGEWKYTDGTAWHVDSNLAVTCLDVQTKPECTYNDGVEFVGGDLPSYPGFGGGGIETSMNSSKECIQECEERAGCKYWTWKEEEGTNCFLKFEKVESFRRPKYVSGSIPSACEERDEAPASVCTYPGIDLIGGDLFSIPARGVDDCRQQCTEQVSCKLFTFIPTEDIGCYLKTDAVQAKESSNAVSGAIANICEEFVLPHIPSQEVSNSIYNENEINGKFRILMDFEEELNDPDSKEYNELSGALEKYLTEMLEDEPLLNEQATFDVRVEGFSPGSVVCNFKVNYVLKEAYLAIPFAIKPSNITDAMNKNFKFKKGILFQRFLIASGSFKSDTPVDHCDAKGCSHRCNYDYDIEEYVCTCPRTLTLGSDSKTCITPGDVEESSTIKPQVSVSFLPSDCLWSDWSDWGPCSCQSGNAERTRTIAIPAKNGGLCSGRYKEVVECNSGPCQEEDPSTQSSLDTEDLDNTDIASTEKVHENNEGPEATEGSDITDISETTEESDMTVLSETTEGSDEGSEDRKSVV